MKKFTRIASLLLALVMVLGLAATAFAEEDQQFTLTIDTHYTNHVYDVYQIFAGTVNVNEEGQRVISNLTWGANVTEEGKAALLTFNGNAFADINELAKYLEDSDDSEIGKNFAAFAEEYLTEEYITRITCKEGIGYQATLPGGYYLIKNPDGINLSEMHTTELMLKVIGNITITPKTPGPMVYKAVWDNNDSTSPKAEVVYDQNKNYVGFNNWDIGDTVRFAVIGTIPSDVTSYLDIEETEENNYTRYRYEIHDQMAEEAFSDVWNYIAGGNLKVYISSRAQRELIDAADYQVIEKQAVNGFVVSVDLADIYEEYAGKFSIEDPAKYIMVQYEVEFLAAAMGAHKNTNKAWVEYLGDGKTNEVITYTGTVEFTVLKFDQDGEPLTGAEFQLQKFMQADNGAETVTFNYNGATETYTGNWVVVDEQMEVYMEDDEAGVRHRTQGLDSGIYKLVETKAPKGYKAAEDLIFKISMAGNYDPGYIARMVVYDQNGNTEPFGMTAKHYVTSKGEIDDYTGILVSVQNYPDDGFVLPETGGMGTTLFYVLGAVLVLGAAVLLITKRRMNTEN